MGSYEGFAELEKAGWTDDGISSGYVTLFSSASDLAIPSIVKRVTPGARVLDLCCGQANVSEALLKDGFSVVGADFSPKMLAHARQRLPLVEFIEADAQNLPFEDEEFDAIICNFGIMHIPDQPKALREIRRVVKPGGQLIMTSWCGPDVSPVFQVFYSSVQEHGDPAVRMPDSPNFHQFANEDTARSILADTGFAIETQERVDCFWLLEEPETLAEIFQQGAPRGGYLLTQQPDKNRVAIKSAVTAKVREKFADNGKWRAPIPASLIVAKSA
ncbi:MAG: methyltransferase domain-containing protein [Pseudomonadota bacterium]